MNNQNNMTGVKIRTVIANERGQIVIPEEIRKEMEIGKGSALVLIARGGEITIRKEGDFLKAMEGRG